MPVYHCSVKTISRSQGRSATAAAAYRAGAAVTDERTGLIHDYTRKSGVLFNQIILPAHAPSWASDRNRLWSEAEFSETRKNSTVAREIVIALPSELAGSERAAIALQFAIELSEKHCLAVEVSMHAPNRGGDSRNFHAHILMSTRRLSHDGFTEKSREWDDRKQGSETVLYWRERWAALQNKALERAGFDVRVSHLSLDAQGIDERTPTAHQGVSVTAMTRRGQATDHQDREAARQAASETRAAQSVIDDLNNQISELMEQAAAKAEQEGFLREQEQAEAKMAEEAFLKRIGWDIDTEAEAVTESQPETLPELALRLRKESNRLLKVVQEYRARPERPDAQQIKNNHKIKVHFLDGDSELLSVSDMRSRIENAEFALNGELNKHSSKGFLGRLIESKDLKDAREKLRELNELLPKMIDSVNSDKTEKIINQKYDELLDKYNQEVNVFNKWANEAGGYEAADRLARAAEVEAREEARQERERLHPEMAERVHHGRDLGM